MSAIQTIGLWYDKVKTERRKLEEEAQIDIERKMRDLIYEFEGQVVRAKNEGAKMTHIAKAMGASRDTAYRYYRAGLEHYEGSGPDNRFGIDHPYDKFLRWEGDAIVVDWPGWLDPATTEWERKFGGHTPGHLKGKVVKQNGAWTAIEDDEHEALQRTLDTSRPGFRDALNEWSGK